MEEREQSLELDNPIHMFSLQYMSTRPEFTQCYNSGLSHGTITQWQAAATCHHFRRTVAATSLNTYMYITITV